MHVFTLFFASNLPIYLNDSLSKIIHNLKRLFFTYFSGNFLYFPDLFFFSDSSTTLLGRLLGFLAEFFYKFSAFLQFLKILP